MVWIVFPGLIAVLLFFLGRWQQVVTFVGAGMALLLAWAAWQLPIGEALEFGAFDLKIAETWVVLGRNFTLNEAQRPLLAMLYLSTAIWLVGAILARPGNLFVPIALGMVVLLTAALAVEPFLYAALLIEITALLSVPLLAPLGKPTGRGVIRFISFQSLGMPFILFTGWMLAGVEASPGDLALVVRAAILMGLGFAFLLAVFPFHSWIPMLAEESHPYIAAFLFLMLPSVVSLLGLGFLDRYAWLRDSLIVYDLLRSIGLVMVLVGGLSAAFQQHLGRMLGYTAMMEIGLSLLAVSLGKGLGIENFFALLLPKGAAFFVWAVALSEIVSITNSDLRFPAVIGLGLRYPLLAGSLVLANFSLAGLPLLAGFPVRLALWEGLSAQYPTVAIGALVGSIGLLVGGLRTVAVLFVGKGDLQVSEGRDAGGVLDVLEEVVEEDVAAPPLLPVVVKRVSYGLGMVVLLLIGLLPQWFFPLFSRMPGMFEQLLP
jgi:formate hydrogenlyase subunit 3/multisubunit Na+/H+ antiporter MnhD subunit